MRVIWAKITAVLLSLTVAGAAHACLCIGGMPKAPGAEAAPAEADPHACCKAKQRPNAPESPAPNDPCRDCNLRNPLTLSVPEQGTMPPAPELAPVFLAGHDLADASGPHVPDAYSAADDVPIPPLLRDLFHTSCRLTL
jgi:hypothetical protein